MTRLLTGVMVVCLLAGGVNAVTVDDIVIGCSLYKGEVTQMSPDLSVLRGRLWVNSTTRAAALPDGNFVSVDAVGNLNIWSGTDRTWIRGIATDSGATALAVDKFMGRIAVGTSAGNVKLYDFNLNQIGSQAGFGGAINDIAFQSDGCVLLCTPVKAWRLDNTFTNVLQTQSGFSSITSLAVQSNDQILLGDSVMGGGKVWVLSSSMASVVALEQGYGPVSDIAVQSDDDILIAANTKLWLRSPSLTGGLSQSGFSSITTLGVQSNDQVIAGDSGTGKVYLFTNDLLDFAASPQSGFGTVNSVTALYLYTNTLTNLNENFEGTLFPPSRWISYTAPSTWINRTPGSNGTGGDSGYGLSLDDYNPSGYCHIASDAYQTDGLAKIQFDFCYRYSNKSVVLMADVDPEPGMHGVCFNFDGGNLLFYTGSYWEYVTVAGYEYQRMTVDTTPGAWQRLVISRIDRFDNYIAYLTNLNTGITQTSKPFNCFFVDPASPLSNKMAFWTNTSDNTIFAIDNVMTQVSNPAATREIGLSGVGPDSNGVMVDTPLSKAFMINYLPSGLGDVPEAGIWTNNYFPTYQCYVFNMNPGGGLDQFQDTVSMTQSLQWSINYNGGGFNHTILGGTVDSFSYNGGNAKARLRCFTTVYTNGTTETFPNGAYQGYGNEKCGQLSDFVYQLDWNAASGTGTLAPLCKFGDVNHDGVIDSSDWSALLTAMDTQLGDELYNPDCDLDGDQEITSTDLSILLCNLG